MRFVYCHFSYRRPRGQDYGIFTAALYADREGKKLVVRKTRAYKLWENHQHVTAIQSYEHALRSIYEWQGELLCRNVTNVLLVTDNSILAKWIMNHKANRAYTKYMEQAVNQYRLGATKEILLAVGLLGVQKSEKSHKFCKPENVTNMETLNNKEDAKEIRLRFNGKAMKSVIDILEEEEEQKKIDGMDAVKELESVQPSEEQAEETDKQTI